MESFSNAPLSLTEIPTVSDITFLPVEASYVKANLLINIVSTVLLTLIAFAVQYFTSGKVQTIAYYASYIIPLIGVVTVVWGYLSDTRKAYALRELDISYRSGLIFRKTITQPILRIQHVEITRGPIERKLELATLLLFSAGGALHTFAIPGLPDERAEQLRQYILDHKDTTRAE